MHSHNGICINAELTNCGTESCYELMLRVFAIQIVENGEIRIFLSNLVIQFLFFCHSFHSFDDIFLCNSIEIFS